MVKLEQQDGVYVLRMNNGENRFNADSVQAIMDALDTVEHSSEPAALVTTGEGKFYSNGLDLNWIATLTPEQAHAFIAQVHQLLARILTFPAITVAAINGHAFAAGAMFVVAHDFRIMRADRGYFCFPEVDIGIPFTAPMKEVIQARLPKLTAHEAMVTGKRYPAEEAGLRQIIDASADEAAVLPQALALAKSLAGKSRATLGAIKRGAYPQVLEAVRAFAAGPGAAPGLVTE